ncbi:glycosyltransferase family 4 protein [Clostridium algidicarnis]|uniref:glycosyltransferase family 4 protein n=1 Tax=Clostridium algidicarnis TaxID=37659 RepID=UPI001C0E4DD5|nr:glycosyltransferase family 4 protein [Clostridium algidicarnis]MBU3207621.1 glycosyltransferase family 4 protein [Clostridium algidicarnis]
MKVLFLSLIDFDSLDNRGIYTDILREFVSNKHEVYVISPVEKRKNQKTHIIDNNGCKILKLKIGNIQKTSLVEKGISTIRVESKFIKGIKKYFNDECFDLVLYATPPVTFQKVVQFVKKRDGAKSYLLLKDIWPQGVVDMNALTTTGLKGLIYKYFRDKEESMYSISDYIGCMSQANIDYLLKYNPTISSNLVEICPNSIEPLIIEKGDNKIKEIKKRYKIPPDRTVFIYGGNLGKPQGIDFLIECLKANKTNEHVYFIIAGSGTEYNKLKKVLENENLTNARLVEQLSKDNYDQLVNSCDVGLIFLDRRFTIPNFPSRLLSYMQASMPVLAATDINTDIGKVIQDGKFGLWCESSDVKAFNKIIHKLCDTQLRIKMGTNARKYLEENYTAKHSYEIIMNHFK